MLALHVTGIWEFCRGAVAGGVGVFGLVGEEDPGRLPPQPTASMCRPRG